VGEVHFGNIGGETRSASQTQQARPPFAKGRGQPSVFWFRGKLLGCRLADVTRLGDDAIAQPIKLHRPFFGRGCQPPFEVIDNSACLAAIPPRPIGG